MFVAILNSGSFFRGAFRKAAISSSPQQYLPPQPEGPVLSPPFYALAADTAHNANTLLDCVKP